MGLDEFARGLNNFSSWSHADKIELFAWYLHTHRQTADFTATDIKQCYEELHLALPSSIGPFINAMEKRKPKEVLRTGAGYRLERRVRDALDIKYGQRQAAIQVDKLLSDLPDRLPDLQEKEYLAETLICFRNQAYRAAVGMCWNLAFDHLCQFALRKHLAEFNAQLPKSFPKADILHVLTRDHFGELKESQVLQICKSANIISASLHKVLKEKLDRRNIAAHPSGIKISQLTAEDFITDLITNVVIKLC